MRKTIIAAVLVLSLPAARAEQKNVKLLTGMSDVELQRTMNFIRASLGVHCDFCHVVKDEWDFPSDEKQTKRTARKMIAMVQEINAQNFEGSLEVSCNTCHRGATRPVSLPPLPQTPPVFPTPLTTAPTGLPARDAVVAKYAAAIGDASRLNLSRVMKGTREASDGKTAPFEEQLSGGKVHIIGETPFGRTEQVFTGSAGWVTTVKGVRKMKDSDIENFQALTAAYEPLAPQAIPADARVVRTEKIGDHQTVVVTARLNERSRQRLYFDTTTGLLVRRLILTREPIGEIPQQTDFDDYREVGGTKFPFMIRVSLVDPWNSATRHFTDVQLGATVDEAVFKEPS